MSMWILREPGAVGVWPGAVEERGQLRPGLSVLGSALDHDVIDKPAGEAASPCPDRYLDAVLLDVGAGGQEQPTGRHRSELPILTPLVEPLPVGRFSGLDPGLAEDAVLEAPLGLIGGRCLPQARNLKPTHPPHG